MIHVIATIQVVAGRRNDFLKEFQRVVPLVRGEDGCIEYGPAIDVDTALTGVAAARADVVTVFEKWKSLEALAAHSVAPHMLRYREIVKDLLVGIEIRVMEPA